MKLPAYIMAGQITRETLSQAVWLAPFAVLGAWAGARISQILPERIFFAVVEIALGVVSLKLLYEVVLA